MQRSILERVFPKPKQPLLPQHDVQSATYHDDEDYATDPGVLSRIKLTRTTSRSSRTSSGSKISYTISQGESQLQPAPLSASIVHHDDPFLAVDRAIVNLEATMQSLLDFQSQGLSGRHENGDQEEAFSERSTSRSVLQPSDSRVTPVRQPQKRRVTLRGARRGLIKTMRDFTSLKDEELRITNDERAHRNTALGRVSDLETKREAVQHEIRTLHARAVGGEPQVLRAEASTVEQEIHELEGRLMELKGRRRHLLDRATQLENTAASELSSYEGTLSVIDKEIRSFLRRPPVRKSLAPRSLEDGQHNAHDMYALRPERRTLELARQQWSDELEVLENHRVDVERERTALLEGAEVWQHAVREIDDFERGLRDNIKSRRGNATSEIIASLDTTMQALYNKHLQAEARGWTPLVSAIGAELEAFRKARALLVPHEPSPDLATNNGTFGGDNSRIDEEDNDIPHADLLGEPSPELQSTVLPLNGTNKLIDHDTSNGSVASSNESLKATLRSLKPEKEDLISSAKTTAASTTTARAKSPATRIGVADSESEDDAPGADFLISHHI